MNGILTDNLRVAAVPKVFLIWVLGSQALIRGHLLIGIKD